MQTVCSIYGCVLHEQNGVGVFCGVVHWVGCWLSHFHTHDRHAGDMFRAMGDLYDPESNPDGSFLFCVAENRLRAATLAQKLHDTMVEQGASKCVTVQTTS